MKLDEIGLGNFSSAKNNGKSIILFYENGRVLQSYNTIVAADVRGSLFFTEAHDCSATTNRHVKDFCGLTSKERNKMLQDGTAILLEA